MPQTFSNFDPNCELVDKIKSILQCPSGNSASSIGKTSVNAECLDMNFFVWMCICGWKSFLNFLTQQTKAEICSKRISCPCKVLPTRGLLIYCLIRCYWGRISLSNFSPSAPPLLPHLWGGDRESGSLYEVYSGLEFNILDPSFLRARVRTCTIILAFNLWHYYWWL